MTGPQLPHQPLIDRAAPWLTAAAVLAITVASLSPKGGAGDPGDADIAAHLVAYGVAILPMALRSTGRAWAVAAALLGWSGLIELAQPLVGRSGGLTDLAANAAGVALGLAVAAALRRALGVRR